MDLISTSPIVLATIPALETAAHDPLATVPERAAALWCYHTPLLRVGEWMPLKTVQLQTGVRLRAELAAKVLRRLVELGYLEDGYHNPIAPAEVRAYRRPRWYRLAYRVARSRAA